jgi:outer membrane biogenesis lipoprotein LolB
MRSALLALALLCGCTPMQWEKQDVSPEQFRADEDYCRQAAWREANMRAWQYQTLSPVFAQDPSGRGSFVWPSSPFVDPFGYQLIEENRLTQFCMEAKGYQLVPAPKP